MVIMICYVKKIILKEKKVKYVVESTLDVNVEAVNVYVQGVQGIE